MQPPRQSPQHSGWHVKPPLRARQSRQAAPDDTPGDALADPAAGRRHGRRYLRVGAALLAVAVLAALLYYIGVVYSCSGYAPTGDALFDSYAHALILRQAPRWFVNRRGAPSAWTLPNATLASWEPRFGADPRYWELRYFATADPPPEAQAFYESTGLPARAYFLEQARQRGKASAAALYALWQAYYDVWNAALLRGSSAAGGATAGRMGDRLGRERQLAVAHGAEMQALLNAMEAAAPEDSFPHYLRARYYFLLRRYPEALAEFTAGNAAPLNRWPRCFPGPLVMQRVAKGQPAGSPLLTGMLFIALSDEPVDSRASWLSLGRSVTDTPELAQSAKWRAQFLQFCCRFGALDSGELQFSSLAIALIRYEARHFLLEGGAALTAQQRQALYSLAGRASGIALLEQRMAGRCDLLEEQDQARQGWLEALLRYRSRTTPGYCRYLYEADSLGYRFIYAGAHPQFARLARFDYASFSWPTEPPATADEEVPGGSDSLEAP